jgi:hypothetical protein
LLQGFFADKDAGAKATGQRVEKPKAPAEEYASFMKASQIIPLQPPLLLPCLPPPLLLLLLLLYNAVHHLLRCVLTAKRC